MVYSNFDKTREGLFRACWLPGSPRIVHWYNFTMKPETVSYPEAAFWERIQFEDLSPAAAKAILKVHFSKFDLSKMRELSAKTRAGKLSRTESAEMAV